MLLEIVISIVLLLSPVFQTNQGTAVWTDYNTLQISFSRSNEDVTMICIEKKNPAYTEIIHIDPCVYTTTNNQSFLIFFGGDGVYSPRKDDQYRIVEHQRKDGKLTLLYGQWFTISNDRPIPNRVILPIIVK